MDFASTAPIVWLVSTFATTAQQRRIELAATAFKALFLLLWTHRHAHHALKVISNSSLANRDVRTARVRRRFAAQDQSPHNLPWQASKLYSRIKFE